MLRTAVGFSLVIVFFILAACASKPGKPVESIGGKANVAAFVLQSLKGTRDGERLQVQASFGDGTQSLLLHLQFRVTPPAQLTSGTWSGLGLTGTVRQRSVTFLGGQSAAPSIGGRFDLIGPDDRPMYRVTIPLQELRHPL